MAKDKTPAFQFYPKDFLTDERVRLMSHTERGVYITLLSHCWLEGSLPGDLAQLSRMVYWPDRRFEKFWQASQVKDCFTTREDGRLTHKRLDAERDKQETFRRRQTDAAASRWHRRGNATASPLGIPPVVPTQCSPISDLRSASPIQRKNSRPKAPADPRALEFLKWFVDEYHAMRHGAEFLVNWPKDAAIVKPMLRVTSPERLRLMAKILLSDKTDDEFIVNSDRGIGVLKVKFNWLSERLAVFEAKQRQAAG